VVPVAPKVAAASPEVERLAGPWVGVEQRPAAPSAEAEQQPAAPSAVVSAFVPVEPQSADSALQERSAVVQSDTA